jgi:hypothetical protein
VTVVIVDVDGVPAARPLVRGLARRLRRLGIEVGVCADGGAGDSTNVSSAVRRALCTGGAEPVLVLFGDERPQRRVVWGLVLAGLLPRLRLVVHADAAGIPYEPSSAEVFARAEVVVCESRLGARAVAACCAEAGSPPPPIEVMPPALPSREHVSVPAGATRRALRRAHLDADDDALVIGCWAPDGLDRVGSLAIAIVEQLVRGRYWHCDGCGHLTPWGTDEQLRPVPHERCARCGSGGGARGRPRADTRLLLVGAPTAADGRWDARGMGAWLGLDDHIVHAAAAPTTEAAHDLAHLWGCIDLHLQPHPLADVPASIRASCVLGIPIVATRYGAVEERLAGAAALVSPRAVLDDADGRRIALMDPGAALTELCRLADDPGARRLTAARVGERVHGWETDALLDRWVELLSTEVTDGGEVSCSTS